MMQTPQIFGALLRAMGMTNHCLRVLPPESSTARAVLYITQMSSRMACRHLNRVGTYLTRNVVGKRAPAARSIVGLHVHATSAMSAASAVRASPLLFLPNTTPTTTTTTAVAAMGQRRLKHAGKKGKDMCPNLCGQASDIVWAEVPTDYLAMGFAKVLLCCTWYSRMYVGHAVDRDCSERLCTSTATVEELTAVRA